MFHLHISTFICITVIGNFITSKHPIIINASTIKCTVVPFTTTDGRTGTCCIQLDPVQDNKKMQAVVNINEISTTAKSGDKNSVVYDQDSTATGNFKRDDSTERIQIPSFQLTPPVSMPGDNESIFNLPLCPELPAKERGNGNCVYNNYQSIV